MASKVRVAIRLDLDHELGHDHYQTWRSQLELAFMLHKVEDKKEQYLASAANLGESASYYLWQKFPGIPEGDDPYAELVALFDEYFGSQRSTDARLAELFSIEQRSGESIQAYRVRIEKEMRICNLTLSASVKDVLGIVSVHLFARGLAASAARKSVLEEGGKDLAAAAGRAQAVVLAQQASQDAVPQAVQVSYAAQASAKGAPAVSDTDCGYCGARHRPGIRNCAAADVICPQCNKRGHFAQVCRSSGGPSMQRGPRMQPSIQRGHHGVASSLVKGNTSQSGPAVSATASHVQPDSPEDEPNDQPECFAVWSGKTGFVLPLTTVVLDNQHEREMRVDSASMVTVLPQSQLPPGYRLSTPPCPLRPVGSSQLQPTGVFEASITYRGATVQETVFVVDDSQNSVPALLGEGVSLAPGLLAPPVSATNVELHASPEELSGLPAMRGPVTISLDPDRPAIQQSARRVAPALLSSLKEQLKAWTQQGVIEPVEEVMADNYVSPLVAVLKPDKTVRWCVDLREVNHAVRRPGIQLPTTDDLLAQASGAKIFSKLDLKSGYSQLELTPDCRHAFVIASPLGYYRFCRLPFGVSSGPELFQRKMEQLLGSCEGVLIYLDDILVFASSQAEHDQRLEAVQEVLKANNVTLNDKKCVFSVPALTFLGHQVSASGVAPGADKVKALQDMPNPEDLSQLRSFLGLATYLAKFVPNLADTVAPLTSLLANDWNWSPECSKAADTVRRHLATEPVLALFDPALATRLEVDASGVGLGAVLMQKHPSNQDEWRPVYYASHKLTGPEARYATIEREALAVVWGLQRFRNFITGVSLTVLSDHKPLLQVFSPSYNLSAASIRVQRLILKVQDLDYQVQFRPGKLNVLADALSRFPTEAADVDFLVVQAISCPDGLLTEQRRIVTAKTSNDPTLCAVRQALQTDQWPASQAIAPFRALRHELSVWPYPQSNDFVILRGEKLVIPETYVSEVLEMAHEGHPGLNRTKARLQESVWWPGWANMTKRHVQRCEPCALEARIPKVPLQPRELPPRAWHSVAVDIFYYRQKSFLSIMDLYSRYPVVVELVRETSVDILAALRSVFCMFGFPKRVISDNGPQFVSAETTTQLGRWKIQHERIVPYTPRQNPVERLHQTLKRHLRKSAQPTLKKALQESLATLRSTINATTGHTPGDLLFRGGFQTPLRTLRPTEPELEIGDDDLGEEVRLREATAKAAVKESYDTRYHTASRPLAVKSAVFVQQPSGATERATVITASPHDAIIETEDGSVQRRHLDRLLPRHITTIPKHSEPVSPVADCGVEPTSDCLRRSGRTRKPRSVLDL